MNNLKHEFLLDPNIVYLNHGSFGATSRPVFAAYQAWQRRLEQQPVQFIIGELPDLLAEARQALGQYLHADADNLVYVPNATFGLNIIARSLALSTGDEVLTTDHEYGACNNVWQFFSDKRGFRYKQQPIPLPLVSDEDMLAAFWQGVTPQTKVIFLSHITSATAVTLPVTQICQRAKENGILTIIDGAHTPGHIPLDMQAIGADFYFGNAHKWLCAPKGAAFLFTRPEHHHLLEPLVVGWGWGEERTFTFGSNYLDYFQWPGTDDLSSYLSVPAAIEFQKKHNWEAVRQKCHTLLHKALQTIAQLTGLKSPYPDESFYQQMAVVPLPAIADLEAFKARLYDDFRVEIPCIQWHTSQFIRISIQGYNSQDDIDALVHALKTMLKL
ncbi:MAG: aminotransferase [Chloroflexi bacterium]|nr:MAG: aminotransferase [Chloroflexota bacterium]